MKISWKTGFFITLVLLGWLAFVGIFVIMNQSTTVEMGKSKCAELEGDLKAVAELLPGKVSKADVSGHQYQRLEFLFNERDTLVSARYRWDKFK